MRLFVFLLVCFSGGVAQTQTCIDYRVEDVPFDVAPRFVDVETGWYDEWLEYTKGRNVYPAALPPQKKWRHPYMHHEIPSLPSCLSPACQS